MRLKTNLATRRYVNTRGVNMVLGALCALLAVAFLFQVQDAAYRAGEIKRLQAASAASGAKSTRTPQVSEAQYRDMQARVQAANQLLARKSMDWVTLLDRLEEVVPPGMSLSSLDPDRKAKVLRISGVTRDFSNLRTFLENLEQSRYFSDVYLLTQQQTKVGLTQRAVTFSVTCKVSEL